MASYELLEKGNWKATVSLGYINGKQKKSRKQGFKTKKEAEKWVREISQKKDKGYIDSDLSSMLFKEFILKWLYEYKVSNVTINTKNDYIFRINAHIIPLIGDYKLNKLTTVIMQDFYNKLISERNLKPVSAKKVFDIVKNCLKYAHKLKLIYELPTDIEKQKIKKSKVETWNKYEVNYFLNEVKDDYLYFPVYLDLLTGLRIGELCGLKWKCVDLENGLITVKKQVIEDKIEKYLILSDKLKTPTSYRTISIPPILINYLKQIKNDRNASNNDFVLLSRQGTMANPHNLSTNFSKRLEKYEKSIDELKKANKQIPSNYMQLKHITFHGLRHTHTTLLIESGENVKVVSERLGHSTVNMTLDTYTHVSRNMEKNTANLLNNIFDEN